MADNICKQPGCGGQMDPMLGRFVLAGRKVTALSRRIYLPACIKCGKLLGEPLANTREETLAENEAFVLHAKGEARKLQECATTQREYFERRKRWEAQRLLDDE